MRQVYYRFIGPMKRSLHAPEHASRGVAVGIFWAFTPMIPIQMYLCGLTWLVARRFRCLDFNLLIALAWIWVTNAFTMIPVYFVFHVTGLMLLGRWEDLGAYGTFASDWRTVLGGRGGFMETLKAVAERVIRDQGMVLGIGCLPYALGGGWLGYAWSLRTMRRFIEHRARRRAAGGLV